MPSLPNTSYQNFQKVCSHAITDASFTLCQGSRSHSLWSDSTCRQFSVYTNTFGSPGHSAPDLIGWLTNIMLQSWGVTLNSLFVVSETLNVRKTTIISKIYRILKRLANRNCSSGDNVVLNPASLASISSQVNIFLEHFCKKDPGLYIPYDLSDNDPALDEYQHILRHLCSTIPGMNDISAKLLKQLSTSHLQSLLFTLMFSLIVISSL